MQNNMNHWKQFSSTKIITIKPSGAPFIPGLGLITLGAVIFLAPKFFLAAISTFFILLGVAACYVAWKFMALKKQVAKLAEDLQNTVEIRAFHVQNDDIDITESDTKKILFH